MPETGNYCEAPECTDNGREEFCGFCGYHWMKLNPEQRAVLLERYQPDVEPIIQPVVERVRTIYPVRTWLEGSCLWAWRVGVTAALCWQLWRAH